MEDNKVFERLMNTSVRQPDPNKKTAVLVILDGHATEDDIKENFNNRPGVKVITVKLYDPDWGDPVIYFP